MTTLQLHNIAVTGDHAPRLTLPHLTLTIGMTVVVGDNGAGKSTLLDVIAGVLAPDQGHVTIAAQPLTSLSSAQRAAQIASLGQHPPVVRGLLAKARIAQGLVPRRGVDARIDDVTAARIDDVAAALGISALVSRPLDRLSGGQRQRVHLARALIDDEAAAVVLDEPFAGLDDGATRLAVAELRQRALRQIVVVSVHDLAVAVALGGRLLGLRGGVIVVDSDVTDLGGSDATKNADRIFDDPVRVVVDGDFVGVLRRQQR